MREFDMIVIGSGAGMNVASAALGQGMEVALVDHGPMGGTCLNNGCIPSKVLIAPADIVRRFEDGAAIGVHGRVTRTDFKEILHRARAYVDQSRMEMLQGVRATEALTWYQETGRFVGELEMQVGKEVITAPRFVIASGSRPLVPDIPGLVEAGYIDNISLLDLERPPESLVIIGGGYIACEYAHFFSAMGSEVTLLGRNPRLLKQEEPEISTVVQARLGKVVDVRTDHAVVQVEPKGRRKRVLAEDRQAGKEVEVTAHEVMLAAGRRSNADWLHPESTGVETDDHGWIKVNGYMETAKPGIWALGDALGRYMFRHTANAEASVVANNILGEERVRMDYHAVPHAVFTYPQVAAVGMLEEQCKSMDYEYLVGEARYTDVTKGFAMGERSSLVKVLVELESRRILGCHIVGPEAAELVQQVVYLMNAGDETYFPMADAQVIHPALSEVVVNAFASLRLPEHLEHLYADHGHRHHHDHEVDDSDHVVQEP
jgi:dihydrolipoamide dehydrogenase